MNLAKLIETVKTANGITDLKAEEITKEGNVTVTDALVRGIYNADVANPQLWTVYYEPTVDIVIANFHDVSNDVKFMVQIAFAEHTKDGIGYLMSFNPTQCHLYDGNITKDLNSNNYITFDSIKSLLVTCLRHMVATQDLHGNIRVRELDVYKFKGKLD